MKFDSPSDLTVDAVSSNVPNVETLTRYRGAFGDFIVAAARMTVKPQVKPNLDSRARELAERAVPGAKNHRVEQVVPITISGMPGRRVSISNEFNEKTMEEEIIVVVQGQTIWELSIFHTGGAKQVEAAERVIRSLSISL